jgi:hypothetical protein
MLCRAVLDTSRPCPNPTRDCGRDIWCGRSVASLESPGLAPVVGVITPQLLNGYTRNLQGEPGWKRVSGRKETRSYRERQIEKRKIGIAAPSPHAAVRTALRAYAFLCSQILRGSVDWLVPSTHGSYPGSCPRFVSGYAFKAYRNFPALNTAPLGAAGACPYPRPTPTYSKPMARSRAASSKFFVSTMMGFLSRCLIRSKSSTRNSGQPVPTTNASMPSAAA